MKLRRYTAILLGLGFLSLIAGTLEWIGSKDHEKVPQQVHMDSRNPAHPSAPVVNSLVAMAHNPIPSVTVDGARKFPYPYQAMLAIASDSDHQTLRKFDLAHQFLNTSEMTPLGQGLGLDIADSFFVYNGSNIPSYTDINKLPLSHQLTYFKGVSNQPYGANVITHFIHSGWIDSLHSFGDFSMVNQEGTLFNRQLAIQAIGALKAQGDDVDVWIDHGNASNVDNFGSYGHGTFYDYQQGANKWSPYYHTDLTIPYGIRFVWPDMNDEAFGRSTMIYPLRLTDGQKVWGFWRVTDIGYTKKTGTEWVWSTYGLADVLTSPNLASIERQHQYSIIAQHFCSNNEQYPFPSSAQKALRLLAQQYKEGNILVARTSRLLQYNVAQQYLQYHVTHNNGWAVIHVTSISDPVFGKHLPTVDELRGITFYTSNPKGTIIEIGDTPVSESMVQYNPSDGDRPSIEIKWYPVDTTDYTVQQSGIY